MNKEQQIKEICKLICATCAQFDGCDINCKAHRDTAETLYNAGYRKVPDGAVILTPEERDEELKACNEKQAELENEIERLKADNEALQMWNNISAEKIQKLSETNKCFASNMKSVLEIEKKNAVKEFAEKLKMKAFNKDMFNDWAGATYVVLVREIDKLLKEYEQ